MKVKGILTAFLSHLLFFLTEQAFCKKVLRFAQKIIRPPRAIGVKVNNHLMYADTLDRIAALVLQKFSISEGFESSLFKSSIREGMSVVDVGANIGYYTLLGASLVGQTGRVFAFEPDRSNFSLLSKNIKTNGYRNIGAYGLAVTNKTGTERLFLCEEHRGNHKLYDSGEGRASVEVGVTSLDDFFENTYRIDVVKIDVQGAEGLVFDGMKRVINDNPHIIIFTEFWPKALESAGTSPLQLLDMFKKYGFNMFVINEREKKIESAEPQGIMGKCAKEKYVNLLIKRTM